MTTLGPFCEESYSESTGLRQMWRRSLKYERCSSSPGEDTRNVFGITAAATYASVQPQNANN